MLFDSHMTVLLDGTVALVNALTDGESRGRPYTAPRGDDLVAAVVDALAEPSILVRPNGPADAEHLARSAADLRRVFEAVAADRMDDAAGALNALLATSGARPLLGRAPDGPWRVHFHGADDSFATSWTAGCATGLAMLLGGELAGRLGVCQAAHCDRVYVDTSRNAGRQFCSTACQNRTKAAAYRARQAAQA
ncbi:CGNR zinc finger domain-containing protein [Yinghuangia seranimata]|uniref:CGNR zinc finger domain-containing protein n=1 Tax=Yinghuangia seranimata TaxID=408067 RepID=UPI00248B4982|nr:CGNR zinc finger domain-containing protein [Yinghuangia seranimata]MDI2124577.1 CGNR zinc finger domain-containing protein [Yinghuangia seranimata]